MCLSTFIFVLNIYFYYRNTYNKDLTCLLYMSFKTVYIENNHCISSSNCNETNSLKKNPEVLYCDRDRKKIEICGTNNRYTMKKVTQTNEPMKTRVAAKKWHISEDFFKKNKQLEIINEIYLNDLDKDNDKIKSYMEKNILIQEVERKIQGYKQQDVDKKLFQVDNFISFRGVIELLFDSSLSCHYCKDDIFVLYEIVRETKQWTLDRVDNAYGHNDRNLVISCLTCNLQRRCQSKDKFSFTKQMKIKRDEYF